MKIAINYADSKYRNAQKYNTKTAYSKGKVDKVIEYGPNDIDEEFRKKYAYILEQKRGNGYWLWKPYIIRKTLEVTNNGDYIFYTDSGSYYIDSIQKLINEMEEREQFIMSFALPLIEKNYTKRDIFEYFNMWKTEAMDTKQRLATFILVKKCSNSINFFEEYLKVATTGELITDAPSIHKPEDKFFIENRHDQSIYSLLCKKWNIMEFRDPSEFGIKPKLYNIKEAIRMDYFKKSEFEYPQIMVLHRKKKVNMVVRFDALLRRTLPTCIYTKVKRFCEIIVYVIMRSFKLK